MVEDLGKDLLKKLENLYDLIRDIENDTRMKNFIDTEYENLFADIANVRNDIENMFLNEIEKNSSL